MGKRNILLFILTFLCLPTLSAQISVVGSLTRHRIAVPGDEYEGIISLKNAGAEIAQAKVYIRDYTFTAEGETGYPEPGTLPRSNAEWLTLSASTAVLAPGETADIKYTVNIPASGGLQGTYWSIIFVEGIPEETEVSTSELPTIAIRQVIRYGVQVVTDFPEDGEANLGFSGARVLRSEAGRLFTVDIANSGTLWLNGELSIELYTRDGEYVSTIQGGPFRVYPQTSLRKTFDLAGLANGTYKALLIADCGGDDLFGGNYTLVLTE